MRQFVLGADVAYSTQVVPTSVPDGALAITGFNDAGQTVELDSANKGYSDALNLVLGRTAAKGGPVVLPLNSNHFSFEKSVYAAATTFSAKVTIPNSNTKGEYAIILAKKGVKFNERNKWTVDEYIAETTSGSDLATKLAARINAIKKTTGLSATVSSNVITITADTAGEDFSVIPAEKLSGVKPSNVVIGKPALNDAKYITDLANKAAADAGFEYTYRDVYVEMYPNYPLNPLKKDDASDTGFTVFTLRFAEPRAVKTRDEVVHQIIQVALPTGAAAISTLETKFKSIMGIEETQTPPTE